MEGEQGRREHEKGSEQNQLPATQSIKPQAHEPPKTNVGNTTGKSDTEHSQKHKNRYKQQKTNPNEPPVDRLQKSIVVATWVTGIATVILAIIAAIQGKMLYQQLEADRPWLSWLKVDSAPLVGGRPNRTTFTILNYGKNAAELTTFVMNFAVIPTLLPDDPTYPSPAPGVTPSQQLLVPNQGSRQYRDYEISQSDFNLVNAGTLKAYVYGKAEYTDLRTGEKHFSHFCVYWVPKSESQDMGWFTCSEYNDAN